MKLICYFGHPAQYLFLRATILNFISKGWKVIILIKTKDVLEDIIRNDNLPYFNILPLQRGNKKISILTSLLKRIFILFPIILKEKPSILIGTDASIAIIGFILRIHRITITEDDYSVIKSLADITYPFTETILCPSVCSVGNYNKKKVGYHGYMKLGYLHPNVFKNSCNIRAKYSLNSKFVLIRLAKLTAHHDFGEKGISDAVLDSLIEVIKSCGFSIYISVEGLLHQRFAQYQLQINPSDMHLVLSSCSLLLSDSQSMSVEAAMLGVPSIRVSSFVGRISVLEELEHKYKLTFGVRPNEISNLSKMIVELLSDEFLKEKFISLRNLMLKDKINVTAFLIWFLSTYPESKSIMKYSEEFQKQFIEIPK